MALPGASKLPLLGLSMMKLSKMNSSGLRLEESKYLAQVVSVGFYSMDYCPSGKRCLVGVCISGLVPVLQVSDTGYFIWGKIAEADVSSGSDGRWK